jgi:hypothetical protein
MMGKNYIQQILWICSILAVAIGIRVLFTAKFGDYQMSGDTHSYYLSILSMRETHTLVDPWRTPVYPLILESAFRLNHVPLSPQLPSDFTYALLNLRIAQSVSGLIALILFYMLLVRLGFSVHGSGFLCLLLACQQTLLANEFSILTEAFSTFWLIIVIFLTVQLFKRFVLWQYALLSVLLIAGVFLRPIYIAFPLLITAVLYWYHQKKIVLVSGITTLCVYAIILFTYSQVNLTTFAYNGISRISDVNLLGKILLYNLPIAHAPDSDGVKAIVEDYRKTVNVIDPWQVYVVNPKLYEKEYAEPMAKFVRSVVLANIPAYLIGATREVPGAIVDYGDMIYNFKYANPLFKTITNFYHFLQYGTYMVFIISPWLIYKALKERSVKSAGLLLLALVSLYHIAFGVYLGYAEYGRHLSVAIPVMYAVSALGFWSIGSYFLHKVRSRL